MNFYIEGESYSIRKHYKEHVVSFVIMYCATQDFTRCLAIELISAFSEKLWHPRLPKRYHFAMRATVKSSCYIYCFLT